MKISVLGAGNIGATIGRKWAASGHQVSFGVRDLRSEKVSQLLDTIKGTVSVVPMDQSLKDADVVLIAIPSSAVAQAASSLEGLPEGKIIIDASNDFGSPVMNQLEVLRAAAPRANLYRAFNNLGWENFAEPVIEDLQVDLFYCGAEGEARLVMEQLIRQVGLRPVYVGDLDQAPVVDALTRLWVALAIRRGVGRRLAFKMLSEGDYDDNHP